MFKVGQTYKNGFGSKVTIIAILDRPTDDGSSLIGVKVTSDGERDIEAFRSDGAVYIGSKKTGLSLIPLPEIVTEFVHPPIPDRRCDWAAKWSDADDELNQRGWGRTEAEAIADLKDNYPREDEAEAA